MKKLKELLKNKKYRALVFFCFYFIFFTVIISSYNNQPKTKENIKLNKETQAKLNINEIEIKEKKIIYNVKLNEIKYNGKIYTEIPDNLLKYNLNNYLNIEKLINKSKLESKNYIENYETYLIKISDFEKIINNNNVDNEDNIKLYKFEDKFVLDLKEYLGYEVEMRG